MGRWGLSGCIGHGRVRIGSSWCIGCSCSRYRLLFGFEYGLILSMFYVWFRVSFDTQYVL